MNRLVTVGALQVRRLTRAAWLGAALVAGLILAGVVGIAAAGDQGLAREDALRQGGASLLLLGGLIVATVLGAGALNRDGDSGHFGALLGAGATRLDVMAGTLAARTGALALVLLSWGIALQIASGALGLGYDADLALHTVIVALALWLTMLAAAAASTVVPPLAAGFFGLVVYGTAQAMVNLKAAADQDLIGVARGGVRATAVFVPQIPTSPMLAELQARDAAGPAVPRVDINGNDVILGASGWGTIVGALVWCALFALLAWTGWRRRPVN